MKKIIISFILFIVLLFTFVSCINITFNDHDNDFTVTFISDGEVISTQTIDNASDINVPVLYKEGYTLSWDNDYSNLSKDTTLTAIWSINQYSIYFNTDGGSVIDSITINYNDVITLPSNPVKEGYIFTSWDQEIPERMPAYDLNLKALYEQGSYSITFNTNGGSMVKTIVGEYGDSVTKPDDPTKTGYTFVGWNKEIPTTLTEDLTIEAIWEINKYTIKFNTLGGSTVADITGEYGSKVVIPSNPTKTSYTFIGWNKDIPTTLTEDLTIEAIWEINKYTIKFNTLGGSTVADITGEYGSKVVIPSNPTKTGYTFVGWNKEIPTTLTEDLTIEAIWEINKYTIYFDTDGGSTINKIVALYNQAITKPNDPTKTGYTFAGWSDELPSRMPDHDINVKAKWIANTYTITFDTDGGSLISPISGTYGSNVESPANPTKTGYTFIGWNKVIPTTFKENLTIKALWKINTYVVTFNNDGVKTTVNVNYNNKVTKPSDPTKAGYTFDGWYLNSSEFNFNTKITKNITLTAKFTLEEVGVNVKYDFGYSCYQTKNDLRDAYYTDFYDFLVSKDYDFSTYDINDASDFITFMDTFEYNGKSEMRTIGDAFGSYYITKDVGGSVENQPTTTFIGYCYQNNKWRDLIAHLEKFFAYWRTDEGYSQNDPNGNDFYASSWASMVDTAKFFYFNGDTLNTRFNGIYSWFDSDRVDEALDYLPGVGYVSLTYYSDNSITLPTDVRRDGYTFKGWYDKNGNKVTIVSKSMTVYAKWEEKTYDYDAIAAELLADFNEVCGLSLTAPYVDTAYLSSTVMDTFGSNSNMLSKWMWLYEGFCAVNNANSKLPTSEGFSWANNRGFYLSNICGFLTRTKHTDTWLKTVSADYSLDANIQKVLSYKTTK